MSVYPAAASPQDGKSTPVNLFGSPSGSSQRPVDTCMLNTAQFTECVNPVSILHIVFNILFHFSAAVVIPAGRPGIDVHHHHQQSQRLHRPLQLWLCPVEDMHSLRQPTKAHTMTSCDVKRPLRQSLCPPLIKPQWQHYQLSQIIHIVRPPVLPWSSHLLSHI